MVLITFKMYLYEIEQWVKTNMLFLLRFSSSKCLFSYVLKLKVLLEVPVMGSLFSVTLEDFVLLDIIVKAGHEFVNCWVVTNILICFVFF